MRVFVAGATGALGLPLVTELVRLGHTVTGLTRTAAKRSLLEAAGATAAVGNVFDTDQLAGFVAAASPTHVVHLLTALPKAGPTRVSDLVETSRVRVEGTRNLLRAAVEAGATRIVAESFIHVYGIGDHGAAPVAEDGPMLPPHRSRAIEESVEASRSLERQILDANRRGEIEGIVLRYGAFYGPQTESTRVRLDAVRRRRSPVIRKDPGLLPFIHLDDAVRATIAAMERGKPGGVYNIADDCPASVSDVTREMAAVAGAPPPRAVPLWLVRLAMPYLSEIATMRLAVSNARAKRDLGWRPRFPTWREGLRDVVQRLT